MALTAAQKYQVVVPQPIHPWKSVWWKAQKRNMDGSFSLRREKQILDFLTLNEFKRVHFIKDTDVFCCTEGITVVDQISESDCIVVTDLRFSRMPCTGIIAQVLKLLSMCPNLYLCLNQHYINIDDSFCDPTLDEKFNLAITQWLKKNLSGTSVIDLSLDYRDNGTYFSWVIPDRQYFLQSHNAADRNL